jgi:hypothetical protein
VKDSAKKTQARVDADQQDVMGIGATRFRHRRGGDVGVTAETFQSELRFGTVAIRKEFITPHQLVEATAIQVREDVEGKPHRLIGQILADLGIMAPAQIDEVMREIAAGSW